MRRNIWYIYAGTEVHLLPDFWSNWNTINNETGNTKVLYLWQFRFTYGYNIDILQVVWVALCFLVRIIKFLPKKCFSYFQHRYFRVRWLLVKSCKMCRSEIPGMTLISILSGRSGWSISQWTGPGESRFVWTKPGLTCLLGLFDKGVASVFGFFDCI